LIRLIEILLFYQTRIGFKNTFVKVKYCFSSNGHILLGTSVQQNKSEKGFLFV